MKCPYRYRIVQGSARVYSYNEAQLMNQDTYAFVETQQFAECFKQECACWNQNRSCCDKKI